MKRVNILHSFCSCRTKITKRETHSEQSKKKSGQPKDPWKDHKPRNENTTAKNSGRKINVQTSKKWSRKASKKEKRKAAHKGTRQTGGTEKRKTSKIINKKSGWEEVGDSKQPEGELGKTPLKRDPTLIMWFHISNSRHRNCPSGGFFWLVCSLWLLVITDKFSVYYNVW